MLFATAKSYLFSLLYYLFSGKVARGKLEKSEEWKSNPQGQVLGDLVAGMGFFIARSIIPTPPKRALELLRYASDYFTLALFFLIKLCVAIAPPIPTAAPMPPARSK